MDTEAGSGRSGTIRTRLERHAQCNFDELVAGGIPTFCLPRPRLCTPPRTSCPHQRARVHAHTRPLALFLPPPRSAPPRTRVCSPRPPEPRQIFHIAAHGLPNALSRRTQSYPRVASSQCPRR
ncbi:hypothetical protein BV25DRAFT_1833107 [Artomyces pyxidatus]|uniref:Uncharacterized protein n=1 Tax=Artomyces pyxidatus TaxID=48021 RepID=A0ACB8SG83_9AGAM|nr:hypothetical protein BV25DRAFT_1833107 [Artomyces pyxidatus]